MSRNRGMRRVVGVVLCIALVSSMAAAPVAASEHDEERFLVELDGEGNADVSVTYVYDLETDSERSAFDELETNGTARQRLADRFENRLSTVAEEAGDATGREMAVTDASVDVESTDGTGVVTVSATWENLAAVDGGRLTVTEPFASGFETDRPFVVEAPEGYEVASTTPAPSNSGDGSATWAAGTNLEGFELVAESDAAGAAATGDDGVGFGVGVAAAALAGGVWLARRTR